VEEVRQVIGCDALIYQDVEAMKQAVGSLNPQLDGFDASCFDGVYVTGDITAEDVARLFDGGVVSEDLQGHFGPGAQLPELWAFRPWHRPLRHPDHGQAQ